MAPRARSTFRSRGPRRALEWFDTILEQTVIQNSNNVTALDSNVLFDEKKGMTLVRTLIKIEYRPTVVDLSVQLSSGICIITGDALAAPTLPDPADGDEQPGWIWRDSLVVISDSLSIPRQSINLDIRAKRKFLGEDLRLVLIQEAGSASTNVNLAGIVRCLMMKS